MMMIGTLAKRCQKEGYEVTVVSGDRDLLQLADRHILIRLPEDQPRQNRDSGFHAGGGQGDLRGHAGGIH